MNKLIALSAVQLNNELGYGSLAILPKLLRFKVEIRILSPIGNEEEIFLGVESKPLYVGILKDTVSFVLLIDLALGVVMGTS